MFQLKTAMALPQEKVATLLESIRQENPDHWPHGLSQEHFLPGDLWAITKKASDDPVGFVGWQEIQQNGERVGCYSIGVAPDYRRLGLAKKAVAHVLDQRADGVDKVVAFIEKTNAPSLKLAQSLGVQHKQASHEKEALIGAARPVLRAALARMGVGATAGALTGDAITREMQGIEGGGAVDLKGMFGERKLNTMINALAGGSAAAFGPRAWAKTLRTSATPARLGVGGALGSTALGAGGGAGWGLLKNIGMGHGEASYALGKIPGAIQDASSQATEAAQSAMAQYADSLAQGNKTTALATLAAALGLGGLGYAGFKTLANRKDKADRGRIRVALPTKYPGDTETLVDLPIDSPVLSNAMSSDVERDIKRRLRHEAKSRVLTKGKSLKDVTQVVDV